MTSSTVKTVGSPANFQELVDMGYQFVSMGADVVALWLYYNDIISKVSDIKTASSNSVYKGK